MHTEIGLTNTILSMLTENITPSVCDSGIYGYSYQKYAGKSIDDILNGKEYDATVYSLGDGKQEISVNKKIPYFLLENLIFDKDIKKEFEEFYEKYIDDNNDAYDIDIMRAFAKEYTRKHYNYHPPTDVINTYNFDNILDGVLQFIVLEDQKGNRGDIIILQTHNGADVRGGYSTPVAFRTSMDDFMIGVYEGYIPLKNKNGYLLFSADAYSITLFNEGSNVIEDVNYDADLKYDREKGFYIDGTGIIVDLERVADISFI